MALSDLPGLVIARLRAECATFSNRVAGTASEARASEQNQLALPHAFFMPGAIEPGEEQLSPLDQEMTVRFRVLIAVDNTSDDRGQAGAAGLYAAAAAVINALVGWVPASGWSAVLCDGLEDSFDNNRAMLWGTAEFRVSIMASDL